MQSSTSVQIAITDRQLRELRAEQLTVRRLKPNDPNEEQFATSNDEGKELIDF